MSCRAEPVRTKWYWKRGVLFERHARGLLHSHVLFRLPIAFWVTDTNKSYYALAFEVLPLSYSLRARNVHDDHLYEQLIHP